ncbi:MAG: arylsulfatase, partial [Ginsengibacter sp.]
MAQVNLKAGIGIICLFFVSLVIVSFQKKEPSAKPNVIIILMDDMGYGDPSCYDGLLYQTP